MPLHFALLLAMHVLSGLAAVLASGAVWLESLMAAPRVRRLHFFSVLSFLGYVVSWLSGGYYYVKYYGPAVKPVIKAGSFPLAHAIGIELKEHVFLFLPFLALTLCCAVLMTEGGKKERGAGRKAVAALAGTSVFLGTLVSLLGIAVSGAVR